MKLISFIAPTPIGYDSGEYNGYVAIPPEHPCYGKHYTDDSNLLKDLDVHGGITFAYPVLLDENYPVFTINPKYIGKRHPLLSRITEILEGEEEIPDNYWILGFDTCHCGDNEENWDREHVIKETIKLKNQLENMIK